MSGSALELLKENVKRNNFPNSKNHAVLNGNCFDLLRELKDRQETYDCIVLDPPKMISSPQTFSSGKKGYVEINSSAMRLIRPGGLLFTFTCSGGASLPDFMKFVSLAASKAGRSVQVVKYLHQSADHPVALKFMGSDYLKGLLCIVN
jgi:23S rRNA (cytosine1962-C5)-methyltransferase